MSDKGERLKTLVRDSALTRNPVLFEAVGVAPLAAMAVSLKTAALLCAVTAAELLVVEPLACLLMKKLRTGLRLPLYAALGMAVNVPLRLLFMEFAPNEASDAGIFLPLLAVSSLIALHCECFAVKSTLPDTLIDAASASAGYALAVLPVGAVREVLGSGTVGGLSLPFTVLLKGMLMPFGGFLLIGFAAAGLGALVRRRFPQARPEEAFDLSKIYEPWFKAPETGAWQGSPDEDEEPDLPPRKKRAKKLKVRGAKKKKTDGIETLSVPQENYYSEFSEILSDLERYRERMKSKESVEEKTEENEDGNGGGDG